MAFNCYLSPLRYVGVDDVLADLHLHCKHSFCSFESARVFFLLSFARKFLQLMMIEDDWRQIFQVNNLQQFSNCYICSVVRWYPGRFWSTNFAYSKSCRDSLTINTADWQPLQLRPQQIRKKRCSECLQYHFYLGIPKLVVCSPINTKKYRIQKIMSSILSAQGKSRMSLQIFKIGHGQLHIFAGGLVIFRIGLIIDWVSLLHPYISESQESPNFITFLL